MAVVKHRCLVLIADGLGDLPIPELGGRTPLEAAFTPHLDRLASTGEYGQLDPLAPGQTPNTDSGTGMLMGLPPSQADLLRRGSVEAAGAGRVLDKGEIAVRANFATVEPGDQGLVVTDRRAGRIGSGVAQLVDALDGLDLGGGVHAELQPTEQHRAVLVLSGGDLQPTITDTDPGDGPLPLPLPPSRACAPGGERAADKLNAFIAAAHERLRDHPLNQRRRAAGKPPANGIITRGTGGAVSLDNRVNALGLRAALVSGCNTVRGLGRLFGFSILQDPRFTADSATDIDAKIAVALEALVNCDIVFLHIKAPDLHAHDRDPAGKRDVIERLDAALAPLMDRDLVIACAADHTTDSNTGFHTADPVPALLHKPGMTPAGNGVKFGEDACRSGTMPRQDSAAFLLRVLAAMGVKGTPPE
ncbi:alkaline phosphatase family protein [Elongatibacter sediminis]|uniref:Alkaline phosphatase family protein n=1 Tax=Elongatibacter sediminis TaxID=3119006 RepID=A0AAW9R5F6_9GAMM